MAQSTWHHPQSVAQTLKLLNTYAGQCVVVGGATTLALRKDKLPPHIIDLSAANLSFVRVAPASTLIGSMTRMADMSPQALPGVGGAFLAEVAAHVATTPLRNMITLGGNVAQCYAWSEMPLALLAMDATIHLRSLSSRRRIKATKFFSQSASRIIRDGEIITQIEYPNYEAGKAAFGYEQIRRTVTDYPLLSVAVFLTQDKGIITSSHIVVGSIKTRPVLVTQPSGMMLDKAIDDIDIDLLSAKAAKDLIISSDPRASTGYKQEMVTVLCRRALSTALAGLAK